MDLRQADACAYPAFSRRWRAYRQRTGPRRQTRGTAVYFHDTFAEYNYPHIGNMRAYVFADVLGLPTLWLPHSHLGCRQHAPDEHLLAGVARQGLAVMAGLFWFGARRSETLSGLGGPGRDERWERIGKVALTARLGVRHPKLIQVIKLMEQHLEEPLDRSTTWPFRDGEPGPFHYARNAHPTGVEAERALGELERPPAEWVESLNVMVVHRMSMSG